MSVDQLSEKECARIVSLFEMMQRAAQPGVDEHIRNEGVNATEALFRLLAKHGVTFADLPKIRQRLDQLQATVTVKSAQTAADQPNLLELIIHVLREYIDVKEYEYVGIALWIMHCHVFDHFQVTPRLALLSPVRGCGKTNLLKMIERLTPNGSRFASVTAASIFRIIEEEVQTVLLIDEGDNAGLKVDRIMRQVLNDGYEHGGHVVRSPGGVRRQYSIFAPAAIGAIGTLPLPLLQRSIVVGMQRSKRDDLKTKEMLATPAEEKRHDAVRRLIITWAQGVSQFNKSPHIPKILRLRTADNWRVLISIADSLNSEYCSRAAREAAVEFAAGYHDEDAPVALLNDMRLILKRLRVDRIWTKEMADELHQLEDGHGIWSAWCGDNDDQYPHAITQGEIATLLRRFHRTALRPKTIFYPGSRNERGPSKRGWYLKQLEPWFAIYCSDDETTSAEIKQLHPKKSPKANDEAV